MTIKNIKVGEHICRVTSRMTNVLDWYTIKEIDDNHKTIHVEYIGTNDNYKRMNYNVKSYLYSDIRSPCYGYGYNIIIDT